MIVNSKDKKNYLLVIYLRSTIYIECHVRIKTNVHACTTIRNIQTQYYQ